MRSGASSFLVYLPLEGMQPFRNLKSVDRFKAAIRFPLFVLIVFLSPLSLTSCNVGPAPATAPVVLFEQMTPAQHLAKAKAIMQADDTSQIPQDQLQEVDRHIDAIPKSALEYAEGVAFKQQIISDAQAKLRKRVRQKYTGDLEASMRAQGFNIVVTEVEDQLIVSSDLLKDDEGRVQFLSAIRKNRDKQGLCSMGFRRVALSAAALLAGNHIYSLGCPGTNS